MNVAIYQVQNIYIFAESATIEQYYDGPVFFNHTNVNTFCAITSILEHFGSLKW